MLKEQGKKDLEDMSLEELDEVEDDEDERVWLEYRAKRLAELKERQKKARFGSIKEIGGEQLTRSRLCVHRYPVECRY